MSSFFTRRSLYVIFLGFKNYIKKIRKRCVKLKKSCKRRYKIPSRTSENGFNVQQNQRTSSVEARLRHILPILPKTIRTGYVDYVWNRMRTAMYIYYYDKSTNERGLKPVMSVVDWYNESERIISVISEYIPGYEPKKRTASYCCICWPYSGRESVESCVRCDCSHRCAMYY